jgi:hypothetical protein
MSKGDALDITWRLFRWLPSRWFPPGPGTRIWATLTGFAAALSQVWNQIVYLRTQTRLRTISDGWVDLASWDFFGGKFPRRQQEGDASFSKRIRHEVLRERNTRRAIGSVVFDLVGRSPVVFEAYNPHDTGGWDIAMGWDQGGAWGDLDLMYQCFVNASRPGNQGVPYSGGWDTPAIGWDKSGQWVDMTMIVAPITDDMLFLAIASVVPAGMIAWVSLEGASLQGVAVLDTTFNLDEDYLG